MQTFCISERYIDTAKVLDRQRLGKQRVEAWQILNTLLGVSKGWANHPAVKMWRGYEYALSIYGTVMCNEWIARGYKDTMQQRFVWACHELTNTGRPEWTFDNTFHRSHMSNLIRKMPEHYRPLWPDVPDDLPYVWPVA